MSEATQANCRDLEARAHKILPGGWAVERTRPLATLLGSCVAVCLFDPLLKIGGMNHFMLPNGKPNATSEQDALLRGDHAMEVLVNALLAQGASKQRLRAKAFGGGKVIASITTAIGATNIAFTREWLAREGIPLLAHDLGGPWSRKLVFEPDSGTAWCRRHLGSTSVSSEAAREEARYASSVERPPAISGKRIELF